MKVNTIKWRIFKYNILVILFLIVITTVIFNIAIRFYFKSNITEQLNTIALKAEYTALHRGPDFFPHIDEKDPPPPPKPKTMRPLVEDDEQLRFFFMLDRSLREPLSVLNADYVLLSRDKEIITTPEGDYFKPSTDLLLKVTNEVQKLNITEKQQFLNFNLSGVEYIAVVKPVSNKNTFGLGWIVIFSSLQKVNQLQLGINAMLFFILLLSSLIIAVFSSISAKKISAPFSSLNQHITKIAERNFATKIHMPVDDELQEFVNNINALSEKLETYDKAQKTFFENVSHEFRTPLMSIQSYSEGIKYDVIDKNEAVDVILDETKRMTHLVEDLLYLSRLDTIEENYIFEELDFGSWICGNLKRMSGIASKYNVKIISDIKSEDTRIFADDEKLSRAFTNIISNCIRYAQKTVVINYSKIFNKQVEVIIRDDGSGIDAIELSNIFERFYKGKKGNFGLGLAISKNIIEKHNGKITAENTECGAMFKITLPLIDL